MPRIKKVRHPDGQQVLSNASKYQKREYAKTRAEKKRREKSIAAKFLRG